MAAVAKFFPFVLMPWSLSVSLVKSLWNMDTAAKASEEFTFQVNSSNSGRSLFLVSGEIVGGSYSNPNIPRACFYSLRLFGNAFSVMRWRLGISYLGSSTMRRWWHPVLSTTDNGWSSRTMYRVRACYLYRLWVDSGHFLLLLQCLLQSISKLLELCIVLIL